MEHAEIVRRAIEEVCTGNNPAAIPEFYSPEFVDHVNAMEFHGYEGARESVALYRAIFPDVRFTIEQQLTEGQHVTTRWTMHGTNRGRTVKFSGITISRFQDGRIIEDWGAADTAELARQLGLWRSLLIAIRHHKLLLRRSQA